jgi:hypothetical protein
MLFSVAMLPAAEARMKIDACLYELCSTAIAIEPLDIP